jgi:hypothetical protein
MTSLELENLVQTGKLKREPPAAGEIKGLRRSGEARLADAQRLELSTAHVLALAALRRLGYRSENRYLVFQTLPHTLGIPASIWRVLAKVDSLPARTVPGRRAAAVVPASGAPLSLPAPRLHLES